MNIGKRIQRIRKAKKISQKKLADELGTDAAYISRIENDKQKPSLTTLERMAEVLECDMVDFFGDKVQLPKELEGKVDWIAFIEDMEEKELTPDEINKIIEVFEIMRGKNT